jgi:hypothetical protein
MVRRCSVCRETGHDKRRCPGNFFPEVAPIRRRGGGVRGRGRGRGRAGQSLPAVPAERMFIRASEIPIREYDFNLNEIFDDDENYFESIITEQDEIDFYAEA